MTPPVRDQALSPGQRTGGNRIYVTDAIARMLDTRGWEVTVPDEDFHLSDQELVLAADGELDVRRVASRTFAQTWPRAGSRGGWARGASQEGHLLFARQSPPRKKREPIRQRTERCKLKAFICITAKVVPARCDFVSLCELELRRLHCAFTVQVPLRFGVAGDTSGVPYEEAKRVFDRGAAGKNAQGYRIADRYGASHRLFRLRCPRRNSPATHLNC